MADKIKDGRRFEFFQLDNAIVDREDLGLYEKMVYIVLCRYANNKESAFPSYNTIAEKSGMSKRKAIDVVEELIKKNLIKKKKRKEKGKKENTSNLYTVLTAKTKVVNTVHKGSASDSPQVMHDIHHGSASHAPKKELSKNNYFKNSIPQYQNFPQREYEEDHYDKFYK